MTTVDILAFVIFILLAVIFILLGTRPHVVTLTDDVPKGERPIDKVLKLSNEIAPYVKEKDGKINLKIVK